MCYTILLRTPYQLLILQPNYFAPAIRTVAPLGRPEHVCISRVLQCRSFLIPSIPSHLLVNRTQTSLPHRLFPFLFRNLRGTSISLVHPSNHRLSLKQATGSFLVPPTNNLRICALYFRNSTLPFRGFRSLPSIAREIVVHWPVCDQVE
jgi:hypothetical protein